MPIFFSIGKSKHIICVRHSDTSLMVSVYGINNGSVAGEILGFDLPIEKNMGMTASMN